MFYDDSFTLALAARYPHPKRVPAPDLDTRQLGMAPGAFPTIPEIEAITARAWNLPQPARPVRCPAFSR